MLTDASQSDAFMQTVGVLKTDASRDFADINTGLRAGDVGECRRIIRSGSRSFYFASLVLPGAIRDYAYALYSFCRYSDDVIDLKGGKSDALQALNEKLDRAYANAPEDDAVERAFAWVVRECDIPIELPQALLEGMAWDAEGVRYKTLDDLYDYAARVAGSVGAMMAAVMGARNRHALARACDLGVAMQLTNIARDIGEDARNGRVYLPTDWFANAGLDVDEWLSAPDINPHIRIFTRRLLSLADSHYERGLSGVRYLPKNCQAGIVAAANIYSEIGAEIARNNFDSINQRAIVSASRKIAKAFDAFVSPKDVGNRDIKHPPLQATSYLVEATAEASDNDSLIDDFGFGMRIYELFMRLERRDARL